jgi:acyl carrier protein
MVEDPPKAMGSATRQLLRSKLDEPPGIDQDDVGVVTLAEDPVDGSCHGPGHEVADPETLKDIEGWDSLAIVSFIAVVNEHFGVTLSAAQLKQAGSVEDLIGVLPQKLT